MRRSATSSRRAGRPGAAAATLIAAAALAACLTAAGVTPAAAKVFMTQEEALALAFPGDGEVARQTTYLTPEQSRRVAAEAGEPPSSEVVTWYGRGGRTAWFDTHIVRTLPETIMVVVSPEGAIERVDILSFGEPEDYLPRDRWIAQLEGRRLDDDLSLRGGVRPITGATLSGRAIVAAARRVLALRAVIGPGAARPPEDKP